MSTLHKRLSALEARPVPAAGEMSPEQSARLGASIEALLAATPGTDRIDRLRELLGRLDTGTETDSDRALLAGLPPCHLTPHDLVALFVRCDDLY